MPHLSKKQILSIICIGLFLAGTALSGPVFGQNPGKTPTGVVKEPKRDPLEFTFLRPEGGQLRAADLRGKTTVLFFSAKGMPLLKESVRQLRGVAERFSGVNVVLVLTNSQRPKDANYASDAELKEWRDSQNLPFPVVRDPNGDALFRRLEMSVLPSIAILARDGKLSGPTREGIDPNARLADMLRPEIEKADSEQR